MVTGSLFISVVYHILLLGRYPLSPLLFFLLTRYNGRHHTGK